MFLLYFNLNKRAPGLSILLHLFLLLVIPAYAQKDSTTPLRIIAFGAHPDDNELKASGVAAMWASKGHKVKFVAMTNGDVGHFPIHIICK